MLGSDGRTHVKVHRGAIVGAWRNVKMRRRVALEQLVPDARHDADDRRRVVLARRWLIRPRCDHELPTQRILALEQLPRERLVDDRHVRGRGRGFLGAREVTAAENRQANRFEIVGGHGSVRRAAAIVAPTDRGDQTSLMKIAERHLRILGRGDDAR